MNKKIFTTAIVVLLIDQLTKGIISTKFAVNESLMLIKNFFSLTYTYNYGGAWNLLNNYSFVLIIFSIAALIILFRFMNLFKNNWRNIVAFGFIVGGTCGNLLDRLIYGYVRDFFDVNIFKYNYPVFNVADICIVVGVILLIYAVFKGEDKNENSRKR